MNDQMSEIKPLNEKRNNKINKLIIYVGNVIFTVKQYKNIKFLQFFSNYAIT